MATITSTELEVRLGTQSSGTLVGTKITESGSPTNVGLNNSTLGVSLSPGTQYCVRARCTNDDNYTTEWTQPYPFKTLILAELGIITPDCDGGLSMDDGLLTYDTTDANIYPVTAGVFVSKNASGALATRITARSIQDYTGQDFQFGPLEENTTYYVIPWVIDQDNREYVGEWNDAESVKTKYAKPTVVTSNVSHTSSSIVGNVTITTNSILGSVYLTIRASGGGTVYRKNLSAQTGLQTWSVADGDVDANGNTIVINPSTEYRIVIYAVNGESGGCTGSEQTTVTTDQQATSTIVITGVDQITPTSARVNLSYGEEQPNNLQQDVENQNQ